MKCVFGTHKRFLFIVTVGMGMGRVYMFYFHGMVGVERGSASFRMEAATHQWARAKVALVCFAAVYTGRQAAAGCLVFGVRGGFQI